MKPRINSWTPEDKAFWESQGKYHAQRNLWISIPCLLCGFSIWMFWSIITVQMKNLGFPFSDAQLFTLSAVAGLTGATLRIPNSFLVALSGGRNVVAVSTMLLLIPALGSGLALRSTSTPYEIFVLMAALSGIGGGAFASSMSNISFFFPKRVQGTALGLNAGLGNLGVSVMQVLLPFVMTFSLFGALGGGSLVLPQALAGNPAGTPFWIQNCGLVWVPILIVLSVASLWGMDNLPTFRIDSIFVVAVAKILWLLILGFAGAAFGLLLLLRFKVNMWLVLPMTIVVTVFLLKVLVPKEVRQNLENQFAIFKNKHNWIMTYLYVMTFGSFIGFSAAFPLLIRIVFGQLPGGAPNPHAPNPFTYAWLGPLVGSLVRPVGGWFADKWGGARVTNWDTALMIAATLGVAFFVKKAIASATPEVFFMPFLLLFLVLFVTTGIGNGSTFRMIPIIFEPKQAGPVLGWTSAVAAYGAFIIPKVFGAQITAGTPERALYGFAVYYLSCLILCWYCYGRKNAWIKC